MILQQKNSLFIIACQKKDSILSCFFDQSCCYLLDITKICHQMKKCFCPKKNHYLNRIKKKKGHVLNNFVLFHRKEILILFYN